MKKFLILISFLIFSFCVFSIRVSSFFVFAQDCGSDLNCQIDKIQKEIDALAPAQETNKKELANLNNQIANLKSRINDLSAKLNNIEDEIAQREEDKAFTKKVFEEKTASHYKFLRTYDPVSPFLAENVSEAFDEIVFRQRAADQDRLAIEGYAKDLDSLNVDKENLEKNQAGLAGAKASLDKRASFLAGEVAKVDAYLAKLSAQQQSLLAQRLASLNIPLYALSAGGCSSDLTNGKNPSFSGGFGLFTFGVPNRVGLNQYGAWGRAKAQPQQNDDQILRAYYSFDGYQTMDSTIKVNDCQGRDCINRGNVIWSGNLEEYVKRVYEVPDSWIENDLAAMKAQAIAIRSYVLATTNNGSLSICATQYCQVFKTDPKGGNWEAAVNATPGKVMVQGGQPIKAFFSSTHGGYAYNTGDLAGWSYTSYTKRLTDTVNGAASSLDDLKNSAYDKDSPWFYCDWGSRSGEYAGTAWLRPDELADVINVILLARQDSSAQPHLCQTDKPPNSDYGCSDTWSAEVVRSKLGPSAYMTVDNAASIIDFGSGRTANVNVSGSGHSDIFGGSEFKDYFNLRAPSNIQIVGPLYNVEKR